MRPRFLKCLLSSSPMELESKPLCAIVIARHGARTPSNITKAEESFWREQLSGFDRHERIQSQLTSKGENDMKELGKKLYKSYGHLTDNQVMKNARFYSTDYDRTKQSAHLVAFEFGADPNAIIFREGRADPLDPWVSIPEFSLRVAQFEKSNSVHLAELKRMDSLKSQLIDEFKDHFSTREDFIWIDAYDICFCASNHVSSPHYQGASRLIDQVTETVTRQFNYLYSLSDIRKLAAGGLFGGLYNWFSTKSRKYSSNQVQFKENPHYVDLDGSANFVFICCHDVNLLPLMVGLNWSEPESDIAWPEYGFHLSFDLMEDMHVRVRDSRGKEKRIPLDEILDLCDKESL